MKMKRLSNVGTYLGLLAILVLVGMFIYFKPSSANTIKIDSHRYISALKKYSENLRDRGEEIPLSISIKALVQEGYLTSQEVEPFEHADVNFNTNPDGVLPQSVMMEAHMPDGTVLALLGDGSVQHMSKTRWKQHFPGKGQPGG